MNITKNKILLFVLIIAFILFLVLMFAQINLTTGFRVEKINGAEIIVAPKSSLYEINDDSNFFMNIANKEVKLFVTDCWEDDVNYFIKVNKNIYWSSYGEQTQNSAQINLGKISLFTYFFRCNI